MLACLSLLKCVSKHNCCDHHGAVTSGCERQRNSQMIYLEPTGHNPVESTLFPHHFNPKHRCDVIESTWKTDWICIKSSTYGHSVFFSLTFEPKSNDMVTCLIDFKLNSPNLNSTKCKSKCWIDICSQWLFPLKCTTFDQSFIIGNRVPYGTGL